MHEVSIVSVLLEQVRAEVEKSGHAGRVLRVGLVVGRLSGVHVDALRFAFELLAPGTIAENASLDLKETKASVACSVCAAEQETDELVACCPECGSHAVVIRGGQELLLESIELED
ncbi:MAG: hydrogenase maturation nickel metallochaperone HypA [Planctomycetes bacterium]|nr:hydrogenase maturation nickel metallochaperone HypA [Planctomycetota bacterium]